MVERIGTGPVQSIRPARPASKGGVGKSRKTKTGDQRPEAGPKRAKSGDRVGTTIDERC